MTPEEWQRVRPILESALELAPVSRPAFLDEACSDPSLRIEVESLILSHEQAGTNALKPGAVLGLNPDEETRFRLPTGKRIGVYEILEEIAVGGMGAVYRAFRADGQYKAQVALKIVRSELGAEFTAARFRNERQILASLNHPNIAKILDGGATADGVPYFVMELIEGQRLDDYCDAHKLTTTERLQLFLQICSAVQYAHQRLIIHRDIKPGNMLVNAEGVPKLLDFGIAKILESSELSNENEQTISLFRLLTPEYASPEQVKGEPITTASDVYSLGVVLYELLTGRTPYNVPTYTPLEISRAVCETEPEKPSIAARRKQIAANDGELKPAGDGTLSEMREGSSKLSKRLSGDLDNIILMALRKEPQRRYASVEQFAQDIRRHLEHLPVLARKSTATYLASKFIVRHKAGAAAGVIVAITLFAALGVTLRQVRIARAERARAEQRFNDVRKLANSLIFEIHDSIRQLAGATPARKLIIQRAQEYLDSLGRESEDDPSLLREQATAYARLADVQGNIQDANLSDTPKALGNYRKAVELLERASGLQPSNRQIRRELAQRYIDMSLALGFAGGDKNGYKNALRKAVQILEGMAAADPEDLETQAALATAYMGTGSYLRRDNDLTGNLEYGEKALAIFERLAKAEPNNEFYRTQISSVHRSIGATLAMQQKWAPALDQYRTALTMDQAQLALHPDTFAARYNITTTYSNTGFILVRQGDLDGGLNYYRKALEIRVALAAADPEDTKSRVSVADTYNYIGGIFQRKKNWAQSLDSFKKAFAMRKALFEKDPANDAFRFGVADSQSNIGSIYLEMATDSRRVPSKELALCRESEHWLQEALPVFLQRKAQGRLMGAELDGPDTIPSKIEKCRQTIARLDRPANSPPQ
jgi:serine/threonine protein kinase/tetratricopeptide (TPR) repeat protein